jgi:predicted nicotinamide N-methyase
MSSLRFKYQTLEFDSIDIHVKTLRDTQQFEDKNNVAQNLGIPESTWSLFGVIWPSSKVLAQTLYDYQTHGKRILEVGCGIGLTSLMLNHQNEDITATDYHPEVEKMLDENSELNQDRKIPFIRTGWSDKTDALGKFDLIIGSDLLYERDHVELLSSFIRDHAKQKCEVIIVDPNRGNNSKFSQKMQEYGFEYTHSLSEDKSFKGKVLIYQR